MTEKNKNREKVYGLLKSGYSYKEIMRLTGLSYSTVSRYKYEMNENGSLTYESARIRKYTNMTDLEIEWTAVVNVIRFYTGCVEPIPLPLDKVHPNPLWQKVAEENIERFGTKMKPLPLPQTGGVRSVS